MEKAFKAYPYGHRGKPRLGEALLEGGLINKEQLEHALLEQKRTSERLGKVLIKLGYVDEENVLRFLSKQLGMPFRSIDVDAIDEDVVHLIPEFIVRRRLIFPISKEDNTLTLAMADPLDIFAIDDIRLSIGDVTIEPVITSEADINKAIEKFFGKSTAMEDILKDIGEGDVQVVETKEEGVDVSKLTVEGESAPVVKLVNHLLIEAIKRGASDVHIEPFEKFLRTRYRIDGVLYEAEYPPKSLHPAIVSRVKIMAKLDIAERRLPQDGRAKVKLGQREIDLRISITPTNFGEKVVMRILDPASLVLDLGALGFDPDVLHIYEENVHKPYGFILITGPTGCGKTTTLYSTLSTINSIDKNIMTIEDPVEYLLPGVNQQHVNPDIGLDFPTALRSFVRQDPDIILVGEIRDRETAEVAINAALTGHLVFSTLHTNDAPGAVTRLTNMGVEPFLISATVLMCVAQRLVRLICPKCKEAYEVGRDIVVNMGIDVPEGQKKVTLYKGKGCKHCNGIGLKGREGVFELMLLSDEIRRLIVERAPESIIKEKAIEDGMVTLQKAAGKKLLDGKITVEEMFRVLAV
jgi:type IV pilus assembly protein PilB